MKFKILFFLALLIAAITPSFKPAVSPELKDKVLVFSKTTGFRHANIEEGVAAIRKLGERHRFDVDATEDAGKFTDENLKQYKALIFLNPTGTTIFDEAQKAAFKNFINMGGGFVGIHSAADCSYEWEWYGKMVGAYFKSHPKIQEANLHIIKKDHPSTRLLPKVWRHTDEWYNFKDLNREVNVLITIDEKSYKGGENGEYHPISWFHNYDGGRAFYTGLGHTKEDFTEDKNFLNHVLGGIEYAIGRKK